MSKYKIKDLAIEISQRIDNPKTSGYDRFVGLEHYDSGMVMISRFGRTDNLAASVKEFKSGDILIARRNVYLKRAGLVNFNGVTSGDSIVIRAKNETYKRLLPFIFNTKEFWDFANQFADGSMSKRLSPKILMEYETELPETEEDKLKLADLLWSVFETMSVYKDLIKQSNELVKARFIEMFGDPNEVEKNDLVIDAFMIRDDLRKPLNDGVRKSMKSGTLYPYYGANGQVDEINDYLMECEALCVAEDCGSYGYGEPTSYIVRGKSWVNNHAHVLIPKSNCNIIYGNVFFHLLDISGDVNGSTRQKLTQGKLKELKMIIPPIELQNEFAKFVEQIEISIETLQVSILKLEGIYKKIMDKYLKKED